MKSKAPFITEYMPTQGSKLYSCPMGNILFGCPPEILKFMMYHHFPLPDTVVIPENGFAFHSSQSCLEFPFYHFLFIQQGLTRGKKFKVFASPSVYQKLKKMLSVTLLGVPEDELLSCWKKLGIGKGSNGEKLKQICKETQFLALKAADGHSLSLDEMVEFFPLKEKEKATIYEAYEDLPAVQIEKLNNNRYRLIAKEHIEVDLSIKAPLQPLYENCFDKITPKEKSSKTEISIHCLGASEGFDPTDSANGLLFHFNGKKILWDCPAYLNYSLGKMELKLEEVDAIFISHVHEDHLEVAETFSASKKLKIYSTPEIYHCFLLKVMAVKNCSYTEAGEAYQFHPIYAGEPFELFGAIFEIFYSVHSIPAFGAKVSVKGSQTTKNIFISGDHLAKRMIHTLAEKHVFSRERLEEINTFLPFDSSYDAVFVDVGAGIIHGDPEDYFNVKSPVFYMHTGKKLENIPSHHRQLKSGQKITIQE